MHFPKFHRYVFPRFLVKDWHIHISPYFFTLRFSANLRHERCHQELTVSEMEKADQNQLTRLEQLQCAFAGALKYLEMMDSSGQGGNEEWYPKVGMFRVGCFLAKSSMCTSRRCAALCALVLFQWLSKPRAEKSEAAALTKRPLAE